MKKVIFRFGKYRNELISESTDISYLKWYYSALTITRDKPAVFKRIEELGDTVVERDGCLVSAEDIELIENTKEDVYNIPIKKYIDVYFERNVDGLGNYRVSDIVNIRFNEVKRMDYNNFTYYLPVFNGKGVKIKNNPFRVHIDIINSNYPEYYLVKSLEKI